MLCTTASIMFMLGTLLRDETAIPRSPSAGLTDATLLMQALCRHFPRGQVAAQTQARSMVTARRAEKRRSPQIRKESQSAPPCRSQLATCPRYGSRLHGAKVRQERPVRPDYSRVRQGCASSRRVIANGKRRKNSLSRTESLPGERKPAEHAVCWCRLAVHEASRLQPSLCDLSLRARVAR